MTQTNTDVIALQVYKTKNYSQFTFPNGNREINLIHLKDCVKAS